MEVIYTHIKQYPGHKLTDAELFSFCETAVYPRSRSLVQAATKSAGLFPTIWVKATRGDAVIGAAVYGKGLCNGTVLVHLLVSPNFRRRGIGTRLVEEVRARHDDIVVHADAGLVGFYTDRGFYNTVTAEDIAHKLSGGKGIEGCPSVYFMATYKIPMDDFIVLAMFMDMQ